MNVLEETEKFNPMKKVSSHKGGEYHGACPGCGGNDRFHVWPEQNDGQGSFWCRSCGKGGDLIQFLMDFCGKNFPEAAQIAGKELAEEDQYRAPKPPKDKTAAGWTPVDAADLDARTGLWKEHAARLVGWAHNQLMKNPEMMAWLIARGIDKDAMTEFKLGLNTGKDGKDLWRPRESWGLPTFLKENGQKKRLWIPRGLVIPYIIDNEIIRIRIRRFGNEEPRYFVLPGGASQVMVLGTDKKAHVVIESELDTIMVFMKVRDLGVGAIGLGSSHTKPDAETDEILKKDLCILNALDFDRAGATAYNWWKERYARCERWPVASGKDPGEAYQAGVDIREWIRLGLPPVMTTKASRLTQRRQLNTEPETKASTHVKKPEPEIKTETRKDPDAPESVLKLYGLLSRTPVKIRNTKNRLTLVQDERWAQRNWGVSREISSLVFFDPDCMQFITTHPDPIISSANFMRGINANHKNI
jgi:DNA primase